MANHSCLQRIGSTMLFSSSLDDRSCAVLATDYDSEGSVNMETGLFLTAWCICSGGTRI